MRLSIYILISVFILLEACGIQPQKEIDLSGHWRFKIDSLNIGKDQKWFIEDFTDSILLPGSMAENNKGFPVGYDTEWVGNLRNPKWFENENYKPYLSEDEFLFPYWLIADKHYYGTAWYQKKVIIPSEWKEQNIELLLERCHWETQVWVDGKKVGVQNSLGTAHQYNLSQFLTPGEHLISICVDNRIKDIDVGPDSHSVSDHTQSNWNGIVGALKLVKKPPVSISNVQIFPDIKKKNIRVQIEIQNINNDSQSSKLKIRATNQKIDTSTEPLIKEVTVNKGLTKVELTYSLGENILLWDEFNPNLYKLNIELKTGAQSDNKDVSFGMREFKVNGTQFTVNDRPIFLRGTLECAIFPKTGYPPTDVESWKRIINICRAHGLNHIRFHSWCPPEAAFIAADEMGFYYQIECSSWANTTSSIGDGNPIDKWLYDEAEGILKMYGNHPSFCLMAYGNEPRGANREHYLADFINHWKDKDDRRVYTGGAGWPVIPENEYHNIPNPRIQSWGEGLKSIINGEAPRTNFDWSKKLVDNDRPVVSHEIGQWCVYPNLKEIEKYDGVLKAKNFEIFKRSLEAHKMIHLADSLMLASGKLQALCYKADIEAALRTKGFGGFQLLDLHDFPGQGTALVGVLDPFWEEKGYISPEEYSRFCNETVPLSRFYKRIFKSEELITTDIEIAHFGPKELENITPKWKIINGEGLVIQKGELPSTNIKWGNGIKLGQIKTTIKTATPVQLKLEVEVSGFKNDWDIWVYPKENTALTDNIKVVQFLDESTINTLKEGGKVLLTPKKGSIKLGKGGEVGIGFSSIFWNTAWTNGQKPHTLGILCNPDHPALAEYPTDYYSDWQWWDAMSHSNAIYLEDFSKDIQPIVRVIDDWVTNRRLALIFEVKIGKGKLLVSGIDLLSENEDRLEAKQLLFSLKKYMSSTSFDPKIELDLKEIKALFE